MMLSQKRLLELFKYDEHTGKLVSIGTGEEVGNVMSHGYVQIYADGVKMYAHRAIWIMVHGDVLVKGDRMNTIDHKNQVKSDNRLVNLELVPHYKNMKNRGLTSNNTSGHKGIKLRVSTSGTEFYEVRVSNRGVRTCRSCKTLGEAVALRNSLSA